MRIAFVQGTQGREAVEQQAERLRRLAPDRYQIEAHPTAAARQRLAELLDGLRAGDELCLASLEALQLAPAEAASTLLRVLDRGANLLLLEEGRDLLDVAGTPGARRMIELLASLPQWRDDAATTRITPALLSDAEIADIRRMGEAGLSPRRIGLIYRRSPKCISDLLQATAAPPSGPARRHA